ncbi:MAG: hypothetical protein IJ809_07460 [Clostridia bacterium]|nr:hypothetical protein [Clostridia bacterium]
MKKRIVTIFSILIVATFFLTTGVEATSEVWVTKHSTQTHTKADIISKYNAAKAKFDYSDSMYEITPSSKAPYVAGKLKKQVVTDTLNQINFFRWLYGLSEVTINESKMERSQKGAVVQAAINTLTHYPTQPSDMDDDFFKEAYAACNIGTKSGDYYNGNCAWGDNSPAATIEGFIDELNNISTTSSVGHRLNLLDLKVNKTSFGYCNKYTALSMYYNDSFSVGSNNEEFYAYPSAGYFPIKYFNTSEYWSFVYPQSYDINNVKIEFVYDNKTYNQTQYHVENSNALVFKMPSELLSLFGEKKVMPEVKIGVKITGFKKANGDIVNYSYDVDFFDMGGIVINKLSFAKSTDEGYVGETKDIQYLKVEPSDAKLNEPMTITSSNANVAIIDSNGNIVCKAVGSTVITVEVGDLSASYTLVVKEKEETATSQLGDVDGNNKIDVNDAIMILKHITGKTKLIAAQFTAADVTKDSKVDVQDAITILKYIVGKIKSF